MVWSASRSSRSPTTSAAQVKEARVEHVFRYAHVYPRAIALLASGKIDVKPLITDTFAFEDSVAAFEFARDMPPTSVKVQIELEGRGRSGCHAQSHC